MKPNHPKETLAVKSGTILRVRSASINRVAIRKLARDGSLIQLARGIYRVADAPLESHEDLALVALSKEGAVICLLSALRFHELTTESPGSVWIAVKNHSRPPRIEMLKLKVHYFSEVSYREGIETHLIAGVPVKIYSVEKTVADCFKFRNQVGTSIAVETLKDAWKKRKVKTANIYHFARICRVLNVMRPYLEGILA
jgi:predicted transcriptional regulator of viral defense system